MAKKLTKLAKCLKERRVAAGLSQWDVASALGYTTAQFISNWERDVSTPPRDTLPTLAVLYRMKLHQLADLIFELRLAEAKEERKVIMSQRRRRGAGGAAAESRR